MKRHNIPDNPLKIAVIPVASAPFPSTSLSMNVLGSNQLLQQQPFVTLEGVSDCFQDKSAIFPIIAFFLISKERYCFTETV